MVLKNIEQARSGAEELKNPLPGCLMPEKTTTFVPTRLLDVQYGELVVFIGLLTTNSGFNGDYIALSYCWGDKANHSFVLTSDNLSSYHGGIAVATLPKTLQDAVTITRGLGVRYLWIDSLCIMQDSVDDWGTESKVMGRIYRHAYCTIAACVSDNSEGGFLSLREPRKCSSALIEEGDTKKIVEALPRHDLEHETSNEWPTLNLRAKSTQIKRIQVFPLERDWVETFQTSPLNSRWWALQERHMSTRVLYTKESLIWECKTLRAAEQLPKVSDLSHMTEIKHIFDLKTSIPAHEIMKLWFRPVADYTSMKLSNDLDLLPALSSIAGDVEEFLETIYIAGLWRSNFAECLLWSPTSACTRSKRYRAPSWSWAAINGKIDYLAVGWTIRYLNPRPQKYAFTRPDIQAIGITPMGSDYRGRLAFGYVSSTGRLRRTRCKTWAARPVLAAHALALSLHGFGNPEVGLLVDAHSDKSAGNLKLDVWAGTRLDRIIYCLCLDTQPDFESEARYGIGLALHLTREYPEEYSRIGLAYNMPLDWFETSSETLVSIV